MNIIIWNYSVQPQAGLPIVLLALQVLSSGGFLMSHFVSTGGDRLQSIQYDGSCAGCSCSAFPDTSLPQRMIKSEP
jgi:hypothetical protein